MTKRIATKSINPSSLLRKREKTAWQTLFSEPPHKFRQNGEIGKAWEIRFNPFASIDPDQVPGNCPTRTDIYAAKWCHVWTNYACAAHGWVRNEEYIPTEAETRAAIRDCLKQDYYHWIERPTHGSGGVYPVAVKIVSGITWIGPAPSHPHAGHFMALGLARNERLIKLVVEKTANLPEGELRIIPGEELAHIYQS